MLGRHRSIPLALVASAAVVAAACSSTTRGQEGKPGSEAVPTQCAPTGVAAHRDLVYTEHEGVDPALLSLDLYTPGRPDACGPTPLVVFVHGGGFRAGDKANRVTDKVTFFTGEGWAFASVNYRLVGHPGSGGLTTSHPAQPSDVAAALGWLTDNAATYRLDPTRLAVTGHSAGAFLAAQVGADQRFLTDASVDPGALGCIVPLDTEGYDVADNAARRAEDQWGALFPAEVRAAASPVEHLGHRSTPSRWLVVTRGRNARVAAAQELVDAVEAAGGSATLLHARPYNHERVNRAIGADDDVITPVLVRFLHECFSDQPS
jgi:arylformamidase